MRPFYIDAQFGGAKRGYKIRASTLDDALAQWRAFKYGGGTSDIIGINTKPTRGVEYSEW